MLMTRTILSNLFHKHSTRLHPFVVRPPLPGTRAELKFDANTCILCKICQRKCPSKVITVDLVEAKWGLNVMGCVSCGVCADVCPTKSITMAEEYRAPLLERTSQTYQCKPRKKKPAAKAESESEGEAETDPEKGAATDAAPPKSVESAPSRQPAAVEPAEEDAKPPVSAMPATAGDAVTVPSDKAEESVPRVSSVVLQTTVVLKPEAGAPKQAEPAAEPQQPPSQTMPEQHAPPTVDAPKPSGTPNMAQQPKNIYGSGKKAKKGKRK